MGSTTTLVTAMGVPLLVRFAQHRELPPALSILMDAGRDRVRRDPRGRPDRQGGAERVGVPLHAEAAHVGQAPVEGRHRVPEVAFGAAEAGVAGADGPAGLVVPEEDGARREGLGALATDVVEAPAPPCAIVVEALDELTGVEVGAAVALIVNAGAVGEERAAVVIGDREPSER